MAEEAPPASDAPLPASGDGWNILPAWRSTFARPPQGRSEDPPAGNGAAGRGNAAKVAPAPTATQTTQPAKMTATQMALEAAVGAKLKEGEHAAGAAQKDLGSTAVNVATGNDPPRKTFRKLASSVKSFAHVKVDTATQSKQRNARAKRAAEFRRQLFNLVFTFFFLCGLTLVLAYMLKFNEEPVEKEKLDAEKENVKNLGEIVLMRYFNLYVWAPLSVVFHEQSDRGEKCRKGDCTACLPNGKPLEYANGMQLTQMAPIPRAEKLDPVEAQASVEFFRYVYADHPVFVDEEADMLHFRNATQHCTDAEVKEHGPKHCMALCKLKFPAVQQVQACEVPDATPVNPYFYDRACLNASATCPNCFLLQNAIRDMAYFEVTPPEDPLFARYMQRAHLYVNFKADIDNQMQDTLNWDLVGSTFFASTLLTTVGYGNYAPQTDRSRLLIVVLGVPMIAVFGIGVSLIASTVLDNLIDGTIDAYRSLRNAWLRRAHKERYSVPHPKDLIGYWKTLLDDHGFKPEESHKFKHVRPLLVKVLDTYDIKVKNGRTKKQKNAFLEYAFHLHDADGDGNLDQAEGAALLYYICELVEKEEKRKLERTKLSLSLFFALLLLIMGGLLFKLVEEEQEWTFLQSLYFVFVSLSTIGLGDFVPSRENYMLWFCYTVLGLGTFTHVLQNVTSVFEESLEDAVHKHRQEKGDNDDDDLSTANPASQPRRLTQSVTL